MKKWHKSNNWIEWWVRREELLTSCSSSTVGGELTIGAGAHVGSGAEPIAAGTPANGWREEIIPLALYSVASFFFVIQHQIRWSDLRTIHWFPPARVFHPGQQYELKREPHTFGLLDTKRRSKWTWYPSRPQNRPNKTNIHRNEILSSVVWVNTKSHRMMDEGEGRMAIRFLSKCWRVNEVQISSRAQRSQLVESKLWSRCSSEARTALKVNRRVFFGRNRETTSRILHSHKNTHRPLLYKPAEQCSVVLRK